LNNEGDATKEVAGLEAVERIA